MEESFKLLEDRVRRAAERLKQLQADSQALRSELAAARSRAEEAERRLGKTAGHAGREGDGKLEPLGQEVRQLRREREEIRARILRLLELLESVQ